MAHRMGTRAAVAAAAITGLVGLAAPASAASWTYLHEIYPVDDDAGGTSVYVEASSGSSWVGAYFGAKGENLNIDDYHHNGRPAIAKLWVGGSGPAVFYANGDGTSRFVNESYDEDQTVYLQVCTSDAADAVCTTKSKGRGRT